MAKQVTVSNQPPKNEETAVLLLTINAATAAKRLRPAKGTSVAKCRFQHPLHSFITQADHRPPHFQQYNRHLDKISIEPTAVHRPLHQHHS